MSTEKQKEEKYSPDQLVGVCGITQVEAKFLERKYGSNAKSLKEWKGVFKQENIECSCN